MPNSLAVTDGTTTIYLSTGGCLLTYYVPTGPAAEVVSESAEFAIIEATTEAVQAKLNSIEVLLTQAIERQSGNRNERAFLLFQTSGDTVARRSEILSYQVVLEPDAAAQLTQALLVVRMIVTRRSHWETASEIDAGMVHILNGDVAGGGGIGEWIGPAGPPTYSAALAADVGDNAYNAGQWANITGVLPTPVHLRITNDSGSSITAKRVFVANDVYARFKGAQHQLAGSGGASWTGASAHTTARWVMTPTAAQIAKMVASGGVRLLAVMASVTAGVYLRAQLQQVTPGPTVTAAWTGPEVLTASGRLVYDLGYVQMPPGVTTFDGWYLVISIYAAATGAGNLDFVQICPGRELVVLDCPGLTWADDAVLDWWGDERYATINNYHASLAAAGRLMLQPQQPNRLMVLVEGATGVDVNARLIVQVKYRPWRSIL